MVEDSRDTMTLQEFYDEGYLQELNRGFLHPLGLAMSVIVEEVNGRKVVKEFGGIVDKRDAPHEIFFAEGEIDKDAIENVNEQSVEGFDKRFEELGFVIQDPQDEAPEG